MFQLSPHLWPPQRRGIEETIAALAAGKDVCLYGPTGAGKTVVAVELLKWAMSQGCRGAFYVNRRLLVGQTITRFQEAELPIGVRCAGYDDFYDHTAPVQICSSQTEQARCYQRKIWQQLQTELVIIDERHLQKAAVMEKIVADHKSRGAMIVGLTATPVGVSHTADVLVISGTLAEYRACKAIVPAVVRSIEQPDLSKVERNKTGEFILDGKRRAIYTQSIVGNVIGRWKKYNPDARPTLLYAPGVAESVWFTEKFREAGVNWCHVDATDAVLDGARVKLSRAIWEEIRERFLAGEIKGISSRFKLREGVDMPQVWHCILATPIGSLVSYIQTVGRVLRYSTETPDSVLVTDHGGNYLRHGSPNDDRPWREFWDLPEGAVSSWRVNQIRERKEREPIRCPKCEGERKGGHKCPHCGFEHEKSQRHVIMRDGKMVEREGRLIRPKYVSTRPDTERNWVNMYWGYFRKPSNQCTFAQMEAFFSREYGYFPPRTLPFMPKSEADWHRRVKDVPRDRLIDSREQGDTCHARTVPRKLF